MKSFCLAFFVLGLVSTAFSQKAAVTDIPADESTTITVTKGAPSKPNFKGQEYEIVSDTAEISGESAPLAKGARESWKKACDEWKKEIRSDHPGKVISISCNSPKCTTEGNGSSCTSQGTFKVRVKLTQE